MVNLVAPYCLVDFAYFLQAKAKATTLNGWQSIHPGNLAPKTDNSSIYKLICLFTFTSWPIALVGFPPSSLLRQ